MIATSRRSSDRRPLGRRWTALAAAAAVGTGALAGAMPAVAADAPPSADTWVSTQDVYYRFTAPQATVQSLLGVKPGTVELSGNIGPAGTWSDLALDPSGANYSALLGPLQPGLYYYTYTATMADRSRTTFANPASAGTANSVTSHPTWTTLFVPGPSVQWMSDIPAGGEVSTLTYDSTVTGASRTAYVWTPPGYDAQRATEYPVLYLLDGAGQSAKEWSELGRVPQVLDNLVADGSLADMVVVMADANVSDPRSELVDSIVPAAEQAFHVSDEGADKAVAGIGAGATAALSTLVTDTGAFSAVGSFSGALYSSISTAKAAAINDATDLVRVYSGNALDPAYNSTFALRQKLATAGVDYEFDGVTPGTGGVWDTWRLNVRDFASRLFRTVADHGPSAGNLPMDEAYTAPAAGSIGLPHVDANRIVTFETGTQWASAKDVTVWANWAPNGAWFRVPMTKQADGRWRVTVGPLDGYYYYRYVVDGVDKKDPADTMTSLTGVTPLFVGGATDRYAGDVPAGQGGDLSVLTYQSTVANEERKAYVWTPPGYDPARAEAYPVLYLNHGSGQSWGDWVETGRAKQILDNHYLDGTIVPMVVVMPNGNVSNFQDELFKNVIPATEQAYHVSSDPAQRALAGLSMGAMNTLNTWLARPGEFAYIGAFSGFIFGSPQIDAAKVNAGTKLARLYTGDIADFTYSFTMGLVNTLKGAKVDFELAEIINGPHGFDTWQTALIDFLPRLFKPDTAAGIPVQATVPEGENGVLALTVADFGSGVALSKAANAGDRLQFTGALPTVTVTDSRTRAQAGAGGWEVTGQAFAFASDVRSIGAEHLGWSPTVATTRDGLSAGGAVATTMSGGTGLAAPARLAAANASGRYGSAALGGSLVLDLPVDTQPGTYTGTLTLSLFPVD